MADQLLCSIVVLDTTPPTFKVFLDGHVVQSLSNQSKLKEAYAWLHAIKTNMAVHDGMCPVEKLKDLGIPIL